jgi:hypothetical protein
MTETKEIVFETLSETSLTKPLLQLCCCLSMITKSTLTPQFKAELFLISLQLDVYKVGRESMFYYRSNTATDKGIISGSIFLQ